MNEKEKELTQQLADIDNQLRNYRMERILKILHNKKPTGKHIQGLAARLCELRRMYELASARYQIDQVLTDLEDFLE